MSIRIEAIPSALQVPIQAVVERSGKFYCLLRDSKSKLAAREVLVGSNNEKFLVIREGLNEGQEVVLNPRAHLNEVGLPPIDCEAPELALKTKSPDAPRPQSTDVVSPTETGTEGGSGS